MTNLSTIEKQIEELKSSLNIVEGRVSLLQEQITQGKSKIIDLAKKKVLYSKSIELLNLVAEVTKVKTKEGFEKIVSYALKYILGEDYNFELEFERRGNLSSLNFNVKNPECKESLDLLGSQAGGVLCIVSVALRVALLELVRPKIEGFICLDEPFHHLSTEFLAKAENLIQEINKKFNRQIILITHKAEFLNSKNNLIKIEN